MKTSGKLLLLKEMITRLSTKLSLLQKNNKLIAIDLSKQQALEADQKQYNNLILQEI